ncbi:pyrroline-5-carboxylate reductase [Metabacillus litoralis]|uniref:Pyrroline-5-carboxylate reductase n=1 Tax=Metabacillus litoralis TaxID=152268 RepID=A0A5C6W6C9_9BACI|nr:pyrroline-5-carboxylate reductase [Metabacillus litoralis]TXC93381.1 pyrroline-5-carboxylate reductase [Metabacillus litoralis]
MGSIGFIGAGSMAEAMVAGLLKGKVYKPEEVVVANRSNSARLEQLSKMYGIKTTHDKERLVKESSIIVLAMKPKDIQAGIDGIQELIENQLIVSVLAGISFETITNILGKQTAIVRAMPNTSAAIGKSATAIAASKDVTNEQIETCKSLFEAIGICKLVEENQLDAVTGLSGSGPAYIYYLVEAMEKAAIEVGLESAVARDLIVQTLLGASEMIAISEKHPSQLRKEVTSPNGTTEAGITILKERGFEDSLVTCIKRATERATELKVMFEDELITIEKK